MSALRDILGLALLALIRPCLAAVGEILDFRDQATIAGIHRGAVEKSLKH